MPRIGPFAFRYRFALVALAFSAVIHAAVIVGIRGGAATGDDYTEAVYTASLDAATVVDTSAPAPAPAKRATPKPRAKPRIAPPPPRPDEIVAQASAPQPVAT